jgi:mono/diheme cytochrome c family protein
MKRILTAACVMAALASASGSATAQDATPLERGKQVYAEQRCSVCHSIAGTGNARGALDGVGSRLSGEEIRAWIVTPAEMTAKSGASRRPVMRAYPSLPKEALDALVAYMQSLKTP